MLFGGSDLNHDEFSGGRFTAGYWLNECQTIGIEGSYFFLGSRSNNFTAGSSGAPGSPVLARPFFDVSSGLPNSELIAFPGLSAGSVSVQSPTRLQGGEANLLYNLCCSCPNACDCCQPALGYRVDLISGVCYLDLREGLGITENIQVLPGLARSSLVIVSVPSTSSNTRNQFYGGQLGARAEVWRGGLFVDVTGKVALGDTHQTVDINGSTTITPPGGPAIVLPGGLLALPTNIGHYSRDQFSVVPQVGVNVGYQVTNNLRVLVGYTLLYWSDVVRPGDQIDLGVNSTAHPNESGAAQRTLAAAVYLPGHGLLGPGHKRRPAVPLLTPTVLPCSADEDPAAEGGVEGVEGGQQGQRCVVEGRGLRAASGPVPTRRAGCPRDVLPDRLTRTPPVNDAGNASKLASNSPLVPSKIVTCGPPPAPAPTTISVRPQHADGPPATKTPPVNDAANAKKFWSRLPSLPLKTFTSGPPPGPAPTMMSAVTVAVDVACRHADTAREVGRRRRRRRTAGRSSCRRRP